TCKVNNYTIPKDSIVLVNAWAIQTDPNNWEDATRAHFSFIPFSAGQRMCPGSNAAVKGVQLVVASLVHYFDWSLPNEKDPSTLDTSNMLLAALVLVPLFFLFLKKSLFGATHLPPGPNAWQVLGNISEFRKKPHVALTNLAKVYGPIMSLRLVGQVVVIASAAAAAKEILKTQDRIFSGRYLPGVYYKIPRAQQSSLAMSTECNDTWKFLRGISQNFIFSSKSVESKADMRKAKVVEMVKHLQSKAGEVVKLDDLLNATIYNIISDILVSRNVFDVRGECENDEKVRALVNEIIEMVSSLGLSDLFPILKMVDFLSKEKGLEIYRKIMYIWGEMVKERRSARRDDNAVSARDFLDVLLENALPDDQICIVIMELLVAGTDSSSITSVWLMTELIRHPDILHRVRDEIAKAFEGDMLINESVLTESQYFQACIKETLRFHIPGPFLVPHRAIETCKVDNYVIPKDCMVLVNAWAIGLEPNSWKDATSFNPDRFLDSKIDFRGTHFEFIPFSAGRRMCPGSNVAFKNIQIVVASLVHYFDWSLPNGMDPTKLDTADKFGTILKKEKPLHLIPRRRE
ncbi:hypothetical protein Pfo_014850, partial [Paulownia fortunei]